MKEDEGVIQVLYILPNDKILDLGFISGYTYSLICLPTPYISKKQGWVILNLCSRT